jgi:hypothetical protein
MVLKVIRALFDILWYCLPEKYNFWFVLGMLHVRLQKRGKRGRAHNRISAVFEQAGWTIWNVKVVVRDPKMFNRHLADIQIHINLYMQRESDIAVWIRYWPSS